MSTPELLAPAGGFEQLRYAVHFGADAVYMGGNAFGLRSRVDAFSDEEFEQGVACAHAAGVNVHVPVNILMHDSDVDKLPAYLSWLDSLGVDAIIASDLGTIRLARVHAPRVAVHLSTQASCSNVEAALAYHELGVSRIVLARELSLSEIAHMRESLPDTLQLEAFVHGSMCMAISGRCLISDYLTGRGGNRGECTQPCRWGYQVVEPTRAPERFPLEQDDRLSYLFNSRDLMMLDHLDDLSRAGVDSLKIEGRGKGTYYVATVVNAYRQVLDGAPAATLLPEMDAVSHRPYSTGFYYGRGRQSYVEGYTSSCTMVATVVGCAPLPGQDGRFETVIRLRNRMCADEHLEVVSPRRPLRSLVVRALAHETRGEVTVGNRTMELYRIITDFPLEADDIIRRRDDSGSAHDGASSYLPESVDEGSPSPDASRYQPTKETSS